MSFILKGKAELPFWKKFFLNTMLTAAVISLAACSGNEERKESFDNTQEEYVYQVVFQEADLGGRKEYIKNCCIDKSIFMRFIRMCIEQEGIRL